MTFRFRSSGAFVSKSFVDDWFSSDKVACSGSLVRTNRGPITIYDISGETRSMTDTVVKNFHNLVKEGHVFFNYMSSRKTTLNPAIYSGSPLIFSQNGWQCSGAAKYQSIYEQSGAVGIDQVNSAFQLNNGYWYPPSLMPSQAIENAINEATARCLNARGRPDLTVLEDWAERKKTAQLAAGYGSALWGTAQRIQSAVHDRGIMRKVRALGGVASIAGSAYLMTRYGLTPVLKTVQGVLKAKERENNAALRQTTRGKSSYGTSTTETSTNPTPGGHLNAILTTTVTDGVEARVMSLDDWKAETTLERYGVDMKGLITLPWELLTLSFVADWLVNVGDVIGSLVPSPHLRQLGGCTVYTRTRSVTRTLEGFSPNGIAVVMSNTSATKTGVEVEKVRQPGLRAPQLVIRNTAMNNPVLDRNWLRFADSLVLSGQALQRVSRHVR